MRLYLPPKQNQPDSISCVPTSTSDAVDDSTGGKLHPAPYSLRRAVDDWSGGMSYGQMEEACTKIGIKADARYGVPTTAVLATVEAGHPVVASIDTHVTAPYSEIRTGTFLGGHSVFLPAGGYSVWQGGERCTCELHSTTRHGEYLYEDPGTYITGYRRISANLLYRAMVARADNGGVNILVLPDVFNVKRRAVRPGYTWAEPSTASRRSRVIVPLRAYTIVEPVQGERWRRPDGTYSTGWYRLGLGDFVRADKLGATNVA